MSKAFILARQDGSDATVWRFRVCSWIIVFNLNWNTWFTVSENSDHVKCGLNSLFVTCSWDCLKLVLFLRLSQVNQEIQTQNGNAHVCVFVHPTFSTCIPVTHSSLGLGQHWQSSWAPKVPYPANSACANSAKGVLGKTVCFRGNLF